MATLRIGEVSKLAGVSVESVRYYERRGLVPAPRRSRSGYRAFPAEVVRRIRFVRQAQALGFSLDQIAELLDLRVGARTSCAKVQSAARHRLDDVEAKLVQLEAMRAALVELLAACAARAATEPCPILRGLGEAGSPASDDAAY